MNQQRKAEIRREAYRYAARELDAIRDWEKSEELFPDEEERDEFENQVTSIVRALETKGQ